MVLRRDKAPAGDFPFNLEQFFPQVDTWRSIWYAQALLAGLCPEQAMHQHFSWCTNRFTDREIPHQCEISLAPKTKSP